MKKSIIAQIWKRSYTWTTMDKMMEYTPSPASGEGFVRLQKAPGSSGEAFVRLQKAPDSSGEAFVRLQKAPDSSGEAFVRLQKVPDSSGEVFVRLQKVPGSSGEAFVSCRRVASGLVVAAAAWLLSCLPAAAQNDTVKLALGEAIRLAQLQSVDAAVALNRLKPAYWE